VDVDTEENDEVKELENGLELVRGLEQGVPLSEGLKHEYDIENLRLGHHILK